MFVDELNYFTALLTSDKFTVHTKTFQMDKEPQARIKYAAWFCSEISL